MRLARKMLLLLVGSVAWSAASASPPPAAATPAAITADPPADPAHPARMIVVHIPSHGAVMNGVIWQPSGPGPHPVAIIYHGFPGNEQNLDLAYALRRAGWSVLTFHYRGSWGSEGVFSFGHVFEDAQAALDFMRDPIRGHELDLDPGQTILIGHSMGGAAAARIGAGNPGLSGVVLLSAADFGAFGHYPGGHAKLVDFMAGNMESLDTSPAKLADEAEHDAGSWNIADDAEGLSRQKLLVVTADDGLANVGSRLAQAVNARASGDATIVHIRTDHSYSDHRIALQGTVLRWLENLRQ